MPNMADRWVSDCVCHVLCGFDYNEKMVIAGWVVWSITLMLFLNNFKCQVYARSQSNEFAGKPEEKTIGALWTSKEKRFSFIGHGLLTGLVVFGFCSSFPKLWLILFVPIVFMIGNWVGKRSLEKAAINYLSQNE